VGRPDDLYRRPANRWVATFVGDANLLPVDDALGICDTAVGPVPVDRSKGPGGGPAKLLVRPEDLRLADGSTGTVELIEYYGHDAMVRVLLGDGSTVHARTGADVRWQRGDLVGVTYVGPGAVPLEV